MGAPAPIGSSSHSPTCPRCSRPQLLAAFCSCGAMVPTGGAQGCCGGAYHAVALGGKVWMLQMLVLPHLQQSLGHLAPPAPPVPTQLAWQLSRGPHGEGSGGAWGRAGSRWQQRTTPALAVLCRCPACQQQSHSDTADHGPVVGRLATAACQYLAAATVPAGCHVFCSLESWHQAWRSSRTTAVCKEYCRLPGICQCPAREQ